jgi:hypothetical protein
MSDNLKEKKQKPKAIYEPGELDKVRKNLGDISPEEAMRVANVLGGEIGIEKTPQYDNFSKSRGIYVKTKQDRPVVTRSTVSSYVGNDKPVESYQKNLTLPNISPKDKSAIDKLMASPEYKIKRPQNFITFIFSLGKLPDRVSGDFISITLLNYIGHIQKFTSCVKRLMAAGSDLYKEKIKTIISPRYKMLNFVAQFDLHMIQEMYKQLKKTPNQITVTRLIPFIKSIYKPLITLYFLGDKRITSYIKTAYAEISPDSKIPDETLLQYTNEACSEWIYINGQVIKGLYPLLMRMCGTEFVSYPKFFNAKISKILEFLDMTKFDLILPEDKKVKENVTDVKSSNTEENLQNVEDEKTEVTTENVDEKTEESNEATQDASLSNVMQGLDLLERIFPAAGWKDLGREDLFPYFQPLYQFNDGFNLLSPKNPMQVTIVLVRILEDFFQACRHINFSIDKDPDFETYNDNLSDVFSEWSLYREVLFDKDYLTELKEYVNQIYSEANFRKLPYAKKKLSNMQWQIKNMFLPHLSFDLVFMERPNKDGTYRPLQFRTEYLKALFSTLIAQVEGVAKTVSGAPNILDKYHFDIPNVVSKRIDVLLGGRKSKNGTNLNLLKYTLSIIYVLDWWINNENSPAYEFDNEIPYRISIDDGTPIFSVPLRSDQNNLFIKSVKSRANATKQ